LAHPSTRCTLSSASVDEWAGLSAWKSFFVDANSMNRLSSVRPLKQVVWGGFYTPITRGSSLRFAQMSRNCSMKTRDTSLDPRKLSIPKVISVDIYLSIKRFYRLQIPIPSSLHPSYQAPLYRSILCEKTPKPPELPLQIHRSINFRGIGNIDQ
jgi:hypothetical protein